MLRLFSFIIILLLITGCCITQEILEEDKTPEESTITKRIFPPVD